MNACVETHEAHKTPSPFDLIPQPYHGGIISGIRMNHNGGIFSGIFFFKESEIYTFLLKLKSGICFEKKNVLYSRARGDTRTEEILNWKYMQTLLDF